MSDTLNTVRDSAETAIISFAGYSIVDNTEGVIQVTIGILTILYLGIKIYKLLTKD
jgi:hypothetical protein